jgi:hypothetical protein
VEGERRVRPAAVAAAPVAHRLVRSRLLLQAGGSGTRDARQQGAWRAQAGARHPQRGADQRSVEVRARWDRAALERQHWPDLLCSGAHLRSARAAPAASLRLPQTAPGRQLGGETGRGRRAAAQARQAATGQPLGSHLGRWVRDALGPAGLQPAAAIQGAWLQTLKAGLQLVQLPLVACSSGNQGPWHEEEVADTQLAAEATGGNRATGLGQEWQGASSTALRPALGQPALHILQLSAQAGLQVLLAQLHRVRVAARAAVLLRRVGRAPAGGGRRLGPGAQVRAGRHVGAQHHPGMAYQYLFLGGRHRWLARRCHRWCPGRPGPAWSDARPQEGICRSINERWGRLEMPWKRARWKCGAEHKQHRS